MIETSIAFSNRDLRKLMIPLIIEQLLAITVGLADSMMVAQVGEAAVSAVSLVDSVNVLLVNGFAALATGGAVVAGQYIGRRDLNKANHSAWQLMLFIIECSTAVTVALYLLKNVILYRVFGAIEPDVAAYANTYFLIVEASTIPMAIYSAGAALFRVMGNSKISMWVSVLMNAINVTGNAVLIFGFNRGVEGVAIPTLVSRIVAAVFMWVLLLNPGLTIHILRPLRFRHERIVIRNILHLGVPNGVEGCIFQLGKILLLSVVTAFGTASVAANAVGGMVTTVQVLAPIAIGLGMVTVVSQCVGAGDYEKARYYTRKLLLWAYVSIWIFSIAIILLTPLILRLYGLSAEASNYARQIIFWHGVMGMAIWPASFTLPQSLRAAGDTRFTMIWSSITMWTCRVVLGVVLAKTFQMGVMGIWYAMFFDWAVRMVIFVIRYRGHRWELKALSE